MHASEIKRIYRLIHIDNLHIILKRKGVHAPSTTPSDGLIYKTIHDIDVQNKRSLKVVPCGPKGNLHDYVPFYFGVHSPMLLRLHTGRVKGYNEGQEPIIYLVSRAQDFSKGEFAFSDGHAIKKLTKWYEELKDLDKIDWNIVNQQRWADTPEDGDRERRKQAEFLVYRFCGWDKIRGIVVLNSKVQEKVMKILSTYPNEIERQVVVKERFYY